MVKKQAIALRCSGTSWLARTLLAAAVVCALSVSPAQADFYRYTDDDGVEVFTNTPTNNGAVKILRESAKRKKVRSKSTPGSMSASDPRLPVQGVITSGYGMRHDPIDGGLKHHNGLDIAVPVGTKVKAIAAGEVIQSGWRGGYGYLVTVEHPGGLVSLYGHNARLEVQVGDQVEAGETIALSGSTGRSTGPHLHFELWKSGVNVTRTYLETGMGIPEVADSIRSYVSKDGSIVFTNINSNRTN